MEERHQHKQKTMIQKTSCVTMKCSNMLSFCYGEETLTFFWKGQLHQISCLDFRSYKRPLPKAIPWNSHERSSLFNRQILDRVMKSIFSLYIYIYMYFTLYDYSILYFSKYILNLSHLECSSHVCRFPNDFSSNSSGNMKIIKNSKIK